MFYLRYLCLFVGGIMFYLRYLCLFVGGIMFYLRYWCLFVGGIMFYLRYLCLFVNSGVQHILRCVFCCCLFCLRLVYIMLPVCPFFNCPFGILERLYTLSAFMGFHFPQCYSIAILIWFDRVREQYKNVICHIKWCMLSTILAWPPSFALLTNERVIHSV